MHSPVFFTSRLKLKERKDFDTISNLTSIRKRDDLTDVLCQLQAFKILVYIYKKI